MLTTFEWLFIVPMALLLWLSLIACLGLTVEYIYSRLERWRERHILAKERESYKRRLRA
jgi:hypothetical protein